MFLINRPLRVHQRQRAVVAHHHDHHHGHELVTRVMVTEKWTNKVFHLTSSSPEHLPSFSQFPLTNRQQRGFNVNQGLGSSIVQENKCENTRQTKLEQENIKCEQVTANSSIMSVCRVMFAEWELCVYVCVMRTVWWWAGTRLWKHSLTCFHLLHCVMSLQVKEEHLLDEDPGLLMVT